MRTIRESIIIRCMEPKQIITDLIDANLTEKQIADLADTSQPTINRIKLGNIKTPSYVLYAALVKLHSERVAA